VWNNAGFIQNGLGIFTAPTTVENNICSFMYISCRVSSATNTTSHPLIISNNKFIASDSSFLNFYVIFSAQVAALNAVKVIGT
jgi:hypothetical protein